MIKKKVFYAEWIKRAFWVLFIAIIAYLLVASAFSTCYLGRHSYHTMEQTVEINTTHTFFVRDSYWLHILAFILFSIWLIMPGRDFIIKKAVSDKKIFSVIVCILAGIASILVVCASQYYPKYDQGHVMEIAAALNAGDYSDLERGGYFYMYPFQAGIIIYFQILSFLFGGNNYVVFQMVNALWIFLTYYLLVKIASILWGGVFRVRVPHFRAVPAFSALSAQCNVSLRVSSGDAVRIVVI